MANLEARIRMAAESILENEALRNNLYDEEAAKSLLHWGVSWAQSLARQTAEVEDDEEADEAIYPRMKALRKMMVAMKDLATTEAWSVEALRQNLETLFSQARILHGETWQPPGNIDQQIWLLMQTKDSRARLNSLLGLITGPPGTESPVRQAAFLREDAPAAGENQKQEGFFGRFFSRLKGG